ncbi:MAG: SIS domain-containing protein [Beutenbergiaceae bacterium]
MTWFQDDARTILGELGQTFDRIDAAQLDRVVEILAAAGRVFVIGVGREGLAARGFAMRLMHAGLEVHWAWDDTTPGIGTGDVLLMVNGSGSIGHLDYVFGQIKPTGATTIVVTGVPQEATPQAADAVLQVPATVFHGRGDLVPSIQPMGSLFEQACMVTFDILVVRVAERRRTDAAAMTARHRNFE